MKINTANSELCLNMNLRRLVNEEGDLAEPITRQFVFRDTGGCLTRANATYYQSVDFAVPAQEKSFTITTGGASNIFFSVSVTGDNKLQLENISGENQG